MAESTSPSTSKTAFVLASIAGLSVSGLFYAWFYPAKQGWEYFDFKYLMVWCGGLLALGGFVPAGMLWAAWRRRDWSATGWSTGLAVGLGGLLGALAEPSLPHSLLWVGFPSTLLLLSLPIPLPPHKILRSIAAFGLLAVAMLLGGFGRPALHGKKAFSVDQRPPLPAAAPSADASEHPDVLLISVDTLRADTILESGVPTPNLDALRSHALVAPYAHAATPSTLPSHVSMMLGVSPFKHGTYTNLGLMPTSGFPTLAETFHQAGYRTVGTAANGLLHAYTGFDRGFEVLYNVAPNHARSGSVKKVAGSARRLVWYGLVFSEVQAMGFSRFLASRRFPLEDGTVVEENAIYTDQIRQLALAYLDDLYAAPTPYFYFLHFMAPHAPYGASAEFRGQLTAGRQLPLAYADFASGSTLFTNRVGQDLHDGKPEAQIGLDYLHDLYREEVMMVDAALGEVFARIQKSGRPTVILFTSDHGEHFGENGAMTHGSTVYAPVLRVPFVLALPDGHAGSFADIPRLVDIPLTLLRAAGFPVQHFGEGRNLLDPALQPSPFAGVHEDKFAVIDGGWKLLLKWDASQGSASSLEAFALYQVKEDVAEAENLLNDSRYASQQARLLDLAQAQLATASQRHLRSFDAVELANLNQLGYVFDEEGNALPE